jgi:hypothetical protein
MEADRERRKRTSELFGGNYKVADEEEELAADELQREWGFPHRGRPRRKAK